jgi:uncharacterized protein
VVSWIVNHQPFLPGMSADAPFAVLFVRLDDGADEGADIHMYGNLVDAALSEIVAEMPVEAVFVDVDDNLTLVQWRPKG